MVAEFIHIAMLFEKNAKYPLGSKPEVVALDLRRPLWVNNGPYGLPSLMSAFGGKADLSVALIKAPLATVVETSQFSLMYRV